MFKVFVSETVVFHPMDGSKPLNARVLSEASDGWWDILVDNVDVEDGTPHRHFETCSRLVGPLDHDKRGLFTKFPAGPDRAMTPA